MSIIQKPSTTTFTGNQLVDVINLIKDDTNIVALHTEKAYRVFHTISFEKSESEILQDVTVVYIDCNAFPDVLDDGKWEAEIKKKIENVKELDVNERLKEMIIKQSQVPNREYFSIMRL